MLLPGARIRRVRVSRSRPSKTRSSTCFSVRKKTDRHPGKRSLARSANAIPGKRCPPVPPPKNARAVKGSCKGIRSRTPLEACLRQMPPARDGEEDPHLRQGHAQARPTEGDERKRDSLGGDARRDDRNVDRRLQGQGNHDPGSDKEAEKVPGPPNNPCSAPEEDQEEENHPQGSQETKLLSKDCQDEIGMGLGKELELLASRSEPNA